MVAAPIVVGGLPIPDDRPLFLAVLSLHVLASAVAVVAGAVTAFSAKRRGRHPRAGHVYHLALGVAFVTVVALALLRWGHNWHLLAIGTVAFAAATAGVQVRRRRPRGWRRIHGAAMSTSYIALLTGFYVDNGQNLPLWRDLPHVSYWLLPAAVGVPIMVRALRRDARLRRRRLL
jgi:hypothetical protein